LISKDIEVIDSIKEIDILNHDHLIILDKPSDSCELLSDIISNNPSIIIFDNDYLENDTVKILKSIRKIDSKVTIILVTSELSIDLGRDLSQLSIHYKALKPISSNRIEESIKSLKKLMPH
jgi:DNA-binding NarL/FixJ family response regulator